MRRKDVLMLMVPIMWGRAVRCIHLVIGWGTPLPFRCFIDVTVSTLVQGEEHRQENKQALWLSVALNLLLSNPVCVYWTKAGRGLRERIR